MSRLVRITIEARHEGGTVDTSIDEHIVQVSYEDDTPDDDIELTVDEIADAVRRFVSS